MKSVRSAIRRTRNNNSNRVRALSNGTRINIVAQQQTKTRKMDRSHHSLLEYDQEEKEDQTEESAQGNGLIDQTFKHDQFSTNDTVGKPVNPTIATQITDRESQTKRGRQNFGTPHLSHSDVRKMAVAGKGKQLMIDYEGRLYVKTHSGSDAGDLYTIDLVQKMPGPFAEKRRGEIIEYGEKLDFPEIDTMIDLSYFHQQDKKAARIVIRSYPERITLSTRVTSVWCETVARY